MSRVELADKFIVRSRRLNAIAVSLAFFVIVGKIIALSSESNKEQAIYVSLFGVKLGNSLISLIGPMVIISFQFLTSSYLKAFVSLTKSDLSLYSKITEPWILLYNFPLSSLFVLFTSQSLTSSSVFFCAFLGVNDDEKITFIFSWSIADFIVPACSLLLSLRIIALFFDITTDSKTVILKSR